MSNLVSESERRVQEMTTVSGWLDNAYHAMHESKWHGLKSRSVLSLGLYGIIMGELSLSGNVWILSELIATAPPRLVTKDGHPAGNSTMPMDENNVAYRGIKVPTIPV